VDTAQERSFDVTAAGTKRFLPDLRKPCDLRMSSFPGVADNVTWRLIRSGYVPSADGMTYASPDLGSPSPVVQVGEAGYGRLEQSPGRRRREPAPARRQGFSVESCDSKQSAGRAPAASIDRTRFVETEQFGMPSREAESC
jgi:hypothetical protein